MLGCLIGSAAAEMYDREYGSQKVAVVDPYEYKAPVPAKSALR